MPNNRFNKQVTPKGYKKGGRVGKISGEMMMQRPMMRKGVPSVESTPKNMPYLRRARKKYKAIVQDLNRVKKKMGGPLKPVDPKTQKGLSKLPTKVRNKMGYMKDGGKVKGKKRFKSIKEIDDYGKQAIASLEGVGDSLRDKSTPMKKQRLKDKFKIKN
jgi:hypothetical protein